MKKGRIKFTNDEPKITFHIGNFNAFLKFNNNDEMRDTMKSWIDNPNLQFIEAENEAGYQVFVNWKTIDSIELTWRYL